MKISNPKGTQDFLPKEALRRRFVTERTVELFERYGFEPLETPAFENIETLTGKYGEEGEKLIFKILKRGEGASSGEADLALRYDLTVPLARVVAQYAELPRPFKRYQIAPVWRAERPQRGRYREFFQCDIDIAGSTSALVEIEILAMASQLYRSLGFPQFTIHLNHRQILTALMETAGIPADRIVGTLITLDKLDKVGINGVISELTDRGIGESQRDRLRELLLQFSTDISSESLGSESLRSHNAERLQWLQTKLEPSPQGSEAIKNLREILDGLQASGIPNLTILINPLLARGLGYYTGAIFEVTLPGFSSSIGGGGRYDGLVGIFSGKSVPACGMSFGLDRIVLMLSEQNLLPPLNTPTQVLVPLFQPTLRDAALALAADLRRHKLNVDVYPDSIPLGKQMQYGSTRGIPFAALLGPDEIASGQVILRDLSSRQQVAVSRSEVASKLKAMLYPAGA